MQEWNDPSLLMDQELIKEKLKRSNTKALMWSIGAGQDS